MSKTYANPLRQKSTTISFIDVQSKELCPAPIQEMFKFQNGNFILPKIRTERMGRETLRYSGPITWNLVPDEIESEKTLESFTDKIIRYIAMSSCSNQWVMLGNQFPYHMQTKTDPNRPFPCFFGRFSDFSFEKNLTWNRKTFSSPHKFS